MNSLVIFEILLVVCAIGALALMRRTYFPMNLFWGFGVSTIAIAAALGALVYGGFGDFKSYHGLFSSFAGSVGVGAFAVAALGGIFARQFHQIGWWITLVGLLGLCALLLTDNWRVSEEVRYVFIGILGVAALYRLVTNAQSGLFLLGGVVLLVAAGMGSELIAAQFSVPKLNVYHGLLAGSVLSFGIFASKE